MYQKSAKLGNTKAMMALGQIYEDGRVVKQDLIKAQQFFELAGPVGAERNENFQLYAFYKIGIMYENGTHSDCENGQPNKDAAFQNFIIAQG